MYECIINMITYYEDFVDKDLRSPLLWRMASAHGMVVCKSGLTRTVPLYGCKYTYYIYITYVFV